jgi:hypothetical protein
MSAPMRRAIHARAESSRPALSASWRGGSVAFAPSTVRLPALVGNLTQMDNPLA